ncbi:MAG: DEAD/DEAH box helicase [Bacteroidia bacterium]|jgi:ATP-dependent RNA helicase RhlE|nr:DEAD/DEAH box helicase [Bacteroidia bacterium]
MEFKEFGFSPELLEGLDAMNFKNPTPIQEQAIPTILAGKDLIASAQTGTGKTAAFLLPLLEMHLREQSAHISTLIIVPTRELGLQIDQALQGFSYFIDISSMAIYGGGDGIGFEQQKKALKEGCSIVIATPGKLLSHLNMGYVNMSHLKHLVLDEVDRMLDMGFIDDITRIIKFLPEKKQTLFFSATMPPKIRQLALKLLHHPEQVNIAISKPAEGIHQEAYSIYDNQKLPLLEHVFRGINPTSAILFAGRKEKVKEVERALRKLKLNVAAIHSDLDQTRREEVLLGFRNRKINILVATDIVSRGIDVEGIELVINYDVPPDPEDYVHRIGRTARAESKGHAITLINEIDQKRFKRIEDLIEKEVPKLPLPEGFEVGPEYAPQLKRAGMGGKKPTRKPSFQRRPKPPYKKPAS